MRSRPFIYTGRGRVGKFKFIFVRWLHVATTLFCPEFVYRYVSWVKAVSMSRGKITTRVALDSHRPLTHVPLQVKLHYTQRFQVCYYFAWPILTCARISFHNSCEPKTFVFYETGKDVEWAIILLHSVSISMKFTLTSILTHLKFFSEV